MSGRFAYSFVALGVFTLFWGAGCESDRDAAQGVRKSTFAVVPGPVVGAEFAIDEPLEVSQGDARKDVSAASDGAGTTLVVWSMNDNLYGSLFDSSGEAVAPTSVVSAASGRQTLPSVAFQGGSFFVVWQDERSPSGSDIYGSRVALDGEVLHPNGLPLVTGTDEQTVPSLTTNNEKLLLTWQSRTQQEGTDIYGALLETDGTVVDPGGFAISSTPESQRAPKATFDGENYVVVWRDGRTAFFYAARVSVDGTVLDPAGIELPQLTQAAQDAASVTEYQLAAGGEHAFLIFALKGSGASYMGGLLIDHNGEATSVFGHSLMTLNTYMSLGLNFDGDNYLVTWSQYSMNDFDVYGALVSKSGSVGGREFLLTSTPDAETAAGVASDGSGFWALHQHGPGASEIHASRLSPEGVPGDEIHLPVSRRYNTEDAPDVASDGTNFLVVWEDTRNRTSGDKTDIYGARVAPDGTVLDALAFPISDQGKGERSPTVAFDGVNFVVAWEDYRQGDTPDIYGARVSTSGVLLDASGIQISEATLGQYAPQIAASGSETLVVWQDYRSGANYDIYGARIGFDGSVGDPTGIPIAVENNHENTPSVSSDGAGFLVAWQRRTGTDYDIYGARVGADGSLDSGGFVLSATTTAAEESPSVGFDGTNYFVLWQDKRGGNFDIVGARVAADGSVLDPGGAAIVSAIGVQTSPELVVEGEDVALVWSDEQDGGTRQTFATLMAPGAPAAAPEGFLIDTSPSGIGSYTAAWNKSGTLLVVSASARPEARVFARVARSGCATSDSTCDGVDDDCDGRTDEDCDNPTGTGGAGGASGSDGGNGPGKPTGSGGTGKSGGDGDVTGEGDGDGATGDGDGSGDGDGVPAGDGDNASSGDGDGSAPGGLSDSTARSPSDSDAGGCACGCRVAPGPARPVAPWMALFVLGVAVARRRLWTKEEVHSGV